MAGTCEAQERNQRALYELELQWGAGRLDYGLIKDILTGRNTRNCDGHDPLQQFLDDAEGHRLVNAIHQRKQAAEDQTT